jgi:hypothetical protein
MSNDYGFFNSFNLKTEKEVNELMNNLTKEESLYFLVESVKYSYEKGLFNLHEAELMSKSIRMLYLPPELKNDK